MISEKFNKVVQNRIEQCLNLLCAKSAEYATEDRLHNFKIAARIQNCQPETALAGMMCKHTVSVYDLIRDAENGIAIPFDLWDEKINDSINYLLLLSALIEERKSIEQ